MTSFFLRVAAADLALKRKLSLPVSKMWRRWAVVILASPKTVSHSLKLRLVVITTLVRSESLLSRWKRSRVSGLLCIGDLVHAS